MSKITLDPAWQERFSGIDRLYGAGSVSRFAACRVAVIGMGGVGSWVVEALARTGIGHLTLIDADDLCVSNTNRQLPALAGQYGRSKVEAMAERCRAINPLITAESVASFVTPSNLSEMLDRGFDLVLGRLRQLPHQGRDGRLVPAPQGAADRGGFRRWAYRSDAGARARSVAHRARRDAGAVRKKLRGEFNFPKNADRYFGISAIYSLENVRYPQADGTVCGVRPQVNGEAALKLDCGAGLGAATHITGTFAFAAVGRALELLLKPRRGAHQDGA
jgi:tRNA A37 threonylcarbamoyladenosine dehydratase